MPAADRNRWLVLSIFLLSTAINYLDRQTLASLAPLVKEEFSLNNEQYGALGTAFSLTYAAGAPVAGMMIDRLGLTRGITLALAVWSLAGILTGLGSGLASLVACRALLGLGEAGGIPAAGKAIQRFLHPAERAIGYSLNQAAISLGLMLAPPLSIWIAGRWGWRTAFVVIGALGLLWIPLWRRMARDGEASPAPRSSLAREILRDRRLWIFAGANAISMVLYSLWSNWTVLYLVDVSGVTLERAGSLASLPPFFSTLGGFAGGWLSFRWMRGGASTMSARLRVCAIAAAIALLTAAIPWMPDAGWVAAGISVSFFAVAAFSVNMYSMPIDTFEARHAAFAVSLLTSSYGLMQAIVSPLFGRVIDHWGYAPICIASSVTPLLAYITLKWTESRA